MGRLIVVVAMNMIATMGLERDCGGGVVLILIVVFVAAAAAAVRLDVWYRRLLDCWLLDCWLFQLSSWSVMVY